MGIIPLDDAGNSPHAKLMLIEVFLAACDSYLARRRAMGRPISEARLSDLLLSKSDKLAKLRRGEVDIGARRMEAAMGDLLRLECELEQDQCGPRRVRRREPARESQRLRARAAEGGAP